MPDRYFVASTVSGPSASLTGPEAHHLAHVLRGQVGDEVVVFDGSGAEYLARIERLGRAEVALSIVSRHDESRELGSELTLGVALPKADRRRWLVEKAVELGVAQLVPLVCRHSDGKEPAGGLDRLRRTVVEASKQCGRNRLMQVSEAQTLGDFLKSTLPSGARLVAHPGTQPVQAVIEKVMPAGAPPAPVALAVGPERGLSDEEIALALAAGWTAVDLGPRILRIETAAVALAAACMLRCQR